VTTQAWQDRAESAGRALWPGIRLGWIPVALTLLPHVPGRRVYAANEAFYGRPGWQFLCAGLLGDLLYVGPALFVAFVLPLAVGTLAARRWPEGRSMTIARVTSVVMVVPIVVVAWMFSVGAIESKLERGLYPTYLEVKVALASSSFVVGSLPTLLLDRYWKTSVVVLVVSAGLLVVQQRASRRGICTPAEVLGFALGSLVLFLGGAELLHRGRLLFPRTGGYLETRSPIETIALGKFPWRDHAALADGMRQLFASREYSLEDKRAGLRVLGYPQESAPRLLGFEFGEPCSSRHPLSRPLDRAEEKSGSDADALLGDLEGLSKALFDGRSRNAGPIIVWQIAMESFRGDDIHALQPLAPPELTPVMSRLYDDRAHAIAFRRAFQGGFRTAQNLSALSCGVGSLPFNIATARDMGHFPLRCLPDVLSDGGFATRAFYASDMAYDSMLEFFRYHGVEVTQAADLPQGLPLGSWRGISDRALYDQVLAQAESRSATDGRAQYNFVLTLSGHSPFSSPTDMPPAVAERVAQACKKSPWAREDDCSRLGVIAYADYALGEFLGKLESSPLASLSIVVVSADHATSEIGLWPGSPEEKGRAHVPYVVYVPSAVAAAAPHPEDVAAQVAALHERAATQVLSLSDSPTLVTALLSSTQELRSIPTAWRFHTFGGQATSPHFAFAARPAARIWGTDSAAFVFSADAEGTVSAYENKNRSFSDIGELDAMNPSLRGPAAFLSSFVKGYLMRCEGRVRLRSDVPVR
jgi:hypothetical protein